MPIGAWHHHYSPEAFLRFVDLDSLIVRNAPDDSAQVFLIGQPCTMCNNSERSGIILNDRSYLCDECLREISTIQYPEIYESKRRQYLADLAAWQAARDRLDHKCTWNKLSEVAYALCILSLLGMILIWGYLFFAALPFALIGYWADSMHGKRMTRWHATFPRPEEPELKHFHDPTATLTERDRCLLQVFNHWPGAPPFWDYLRQVVLNRDGFRCQVTGCPTRLGLQVHHKKRRADGGAHTPENLVTLCDFHHALEPDFGHERIWADIKNEYFTLVRRHERRNPVNPGSHEVTRHLRRLQLVAIEELNAIIEFYGLSCPMCYNGEMELSFPDDKTVSITCQSCGANWNGPRQLAEETGPLLAEILKVTKNHGSWQSNWDVLTTRKSTSVSNWVKSEKSRHKRPKRHKRWNSTEKPKCPICGAPMKVIRPSPGDNWRSFWGCTNYKITGCRGKIDRV